MWHLLIALFISDTPLTHELWKFYFHVLLLLLNNLGLFTIKLWKFYIIFKIREEAGRLVSFFVLKTVRQGQGIEFGMTDSVWTTGLRQASGSPGGGGGGHYVCHQKTLLTPFVDGRWSSSYCSKNVLTPFCHIVDTTYLFWIKFVSIMCIKIKLFTYLNKTCLNN